MNALRWFGGWILPIGLTAALALGLKFPLHGGEREEVDKQTKKLRHLHDLLRKNYVEEVETQKLFDGAAKGMLQSLDAHSQYFTAEEMEEFKRDTEGHYGGIGVQVEFTPDGLEIQAAFEDTPAFRAGLVAGDKITEIDGKSTEGMNATEAATHIRGVPGTTVVLTVLRTLTKKSEKVTITRAEISIPTVKGTGFVDEKSKVGYVRLLQFQEDSFDKLKASIDGLLAQGMKALIIDLRFNGGGLLVQAEKIADLFLVSGVIVETKGRIEESNSKVQAEAEGTYPNFPVVLLVNDGSASASEIVAGALQDHRRAILVGSKTYGKGSVQQYLTEELGDGTGFKYTMARYYTPKGRWIDRKAGKDYGLEPDFEVNLTPEQTMELMEHWRKQDAKEKTDYVDLQLDKAVTVVKAALLVRGEK